MTSHLPEDELIRANFGFNSVTHMSSVTKCCYGQSYSHVYYRVVQVNFSLG